MKVAFVAYRRWAFEILKLLLAHKSANWQIVGAYNDTSKVRECQPDIILLYGWSWLVSKEFLSIAPCICLHPSPLPLYRGGSPLQYQIMAGEKESAVTLLMVTEGVDSGPILAQEAFSLEGELDDIFQRIISIGAELTMKVLDGLALKTLSPIPQDEAHKTVYKRRKPEESEITIEEINASSAEFIYNKIRALQDPYPNAYIVCGDGAKVYLTKVHLGIMVGE